MTNISRYWQQPPTAQRTLIDTIEKRCKSEEVEAKRVVGYATTIEAPDSTMYPRQQDRDIVVCWDCFGDPRDQPDEDRWEPITKAEYLDKESTAFNAKCEDCGKMLV